MRQRFRPFSIRGVDASRRVPNLAHVEELEYAGLLG